MEHNVTFLLLAQCIILFYSRRMDPTEYLSYRLSLDMTQSELAEALGVTRLTIARRESGETPISIEAAMAIEALWIKTTNALINTGE